MTTHTGAFLRMPYRRKAKVDEAHENGTLSGHVSGKLDFK